MSSSCRVMFFLLYRQKDINNVIDFYLPKRKMPTNTEITSWINSCVRLWKTGCKENHFYSLPFGQAEASIYQPRRHFNQPQKLVVLLLFKFLIKHHQPVGQVKNRIHQPDSKIHQPRAVGQYFLCTLENKPLRSWMQFL